MAKEIVVPSSDERNVRARKFWAQQMEDEAQASQVFGDKDERRHERLRVQQEWEKMAHDKKEGLDDRSAWRGHCQRMFRMAHSIMDPQKALRRARHFEAEGLTTAANFFYNRAQKLSGREEKAMGQKEDVLKELQSFNTAAFVHGSLEKQGLPLSKPHKYIKRVLLPGGGYKYVYEEPAGTTARRAAPPPTPAEREGGLKARPTGTVAGPHDKRDYKELRGMVNSVKKRPAFYVAKANWQAAAPAKWLDLNRAVGQVEGQFKAFAERGGYKGHVKIDPKGKKPPEEFGKRYAEKRFWLAQAMNMHDDANHLAAQRDAIRIPKAPKAAPAAVAPAPKPEFKPPTIW